MLKRDLKFLSKRSSRIGKISLGILILLFFAGYQPTLAIPPIKKTIALAQSAQQQVTAASFSEIFGLPHPGFLTTAFTNWHPGIDIATGLGMPVRPIAKGVVSEVTLGFWGLGHYITVDHTEGFRSIYAHMGRVFVKKGTSIEANTILGEVGMTGNTSGPHTHLEVMRFGQYVDPLTILPLVPTYQEWAKTQSIGGR